MSAREETQAIPQALRDAVDERDGGFCRMCGAYLGLRRAIHHIHYGGDKQGMGGRRHHELSNLISLCWLPGNNRCHERAHSEKAYWEKILSDVLAYPGNVTGFQVARWSRQKEPTS